MLTDGKLQDHLVNGSVMTPKVTELEALSTAIKKALRALKGAPGIPDAPADMQIIANAKAIGLTVLPEATLQQLLTATENRLQEEILAEFKRALEANLLVAGVKRRKKRPQPTSDSLPPSQDYGA
jgi:hypothetical protein